MIKNRLTINEFYLLSGKVELRIHWIGTAEKFVMRSN